MFHIWNGYLRWILSTIGALFFSGMVYSQSSQTGMVTVDDFSWSIDNEYLTINSAHGVIVDSPDSSICQDGIGTIQCGLLLIVDNQFEYMLRSSSGDAFTANVAVETLNNISNTRIPLSSLGLANGSKPTRACVYRYKKTRDMEGDDILDGVCSGGPLPPEPTPVKCNVAISNNTIDFGQISAGKFSSAGAGNTPEGVSPQTRTVKVECDNDGGVSNLKLFLKTNNVEGNFIRSSNKNIGFAIKDSVGSVVVPNDSSQGISASLGEDNSVSVNITAELNSCAE